MKMDKSLPLDSPADVRAAVTQAESDGYDAIWTSETRHDPLMQLAVASTVVQRAQLGTAITVAFARNPMNLAVAANDLQVLTGGRFLLGLGSQIKPHITRRFSMPWSHPAPRMREFILAMRAIWDSWQNDTPLAFEGEYYTHTLMTPFFAPEKHDFGPPKVLLAGVGELMTATAGEVADGFLCHGFTTERYVREVTLPGLERGFAASGRTRADFTLSLPVFVVTGRSDEEWERARTGTKRQIAFYGSTPGYHGVLRLHGWDDVGPQLNELSRKGEWVAMGDLITDEMLDTFAVVAPPDEVAPAIVARYGDVLDRVNLDTPYESDAEMWSATRAQLKASG
jgi:probable F420-dependent oxidoreductase